MAYTCMTLVQNMNGLERIPRTVACNRLTGHANVLSSYHKDCTQKEKWRGGDVSLANTPSLIAVVIEYGMCGGLFGARAAGLCRSLRV